jgi:glycosyltransferase involved in cell wall biosynthesis
MSSEVTRLCIVTPHHPSGSSGGAEFQIECLLEALIPERRYDITYIARSVKHGFQPKGYRIVRIGKSSRQPRFGYGMDAIPLYSALRKIKPHVIYQRVACGYSGICTYYARQHDSRMIWHVAHDTDVSGQTLDPGRNPIRPLLDAASIRYTIRHVNHIVTQTQTQSQLLEANYHRHADGVVPNFHPDPHEPLDKTGPPLVLWVANFKRWKRPELFLDLAAGLSDLKDVRFVMIGAEAGGSGSRDWNAAVMQRLRSLPNVQYLGSQTQAQINQLLARAHVFVNTSVSEGFPNTFIQAWMRAVPVVSLSVDPDGVLERERIGFHADSAQGLESAVRRLLVEPGLRAQFGERARRYALATHSLRNAGMLMRLIDMGSMASSQLGTGRPSPAEGGPA